MEQLQFDRAAICLNLTDMRGISEQISITLGDSVYIFEPGMDNRGIANTGVHAIANLSELKQNKKTAIRNKNQTERFTVTQLYSIG